MYHATLFPALALLFAIAEARFGQEQSVAPLVSALGEFGNPGEAASLAGATPGVLLAAGNPCAQVSFSLSPSQQLKRHTVL